MSSERKVPIRTCISCRASSEKRQLIRIVRTSDGNVRIDPTGKLAGRGAYVCARKECLVLLGKHGKLGRALRCTVPEGLMIELEKLVVEDNVRQ